MQEDYNAILEADACSRRGDRAGAFLNIQKGLVCNYKNYELYYMLGEYYLDENPMKSYLCFENAEYYCDNADDMRIISQTRENLVSQGISVPKVSIITVSYNCMPEMQLCLDGLRASVNPETCEIIVVDNASTDGVTDYLKQQPDIRLICNAQNMGFAAGCNQGIKMAALGNDIFLLNNDTVIAPNALFWLRMGLYENGAVGGTGSVSNCAPNFQQIAEIYNTPAEYMEYAFKNNIPLEHPYENRLKLSGFAFLIKRTVLDEVGLLDERFFPGYCEDDDLSFRIIKSGYKLLMCRNSFIYHFGSRSFSKNLEKCSLYMQTNAEKFKEKWGFDMRYYCYERRELVCHMDYAGGKPVNILEIGCGMGATLGYIKNTYPSAEVYGIELENNIAMMARHYVPTVICGNIENLELPYKEGFFDYIIMADVLEHLINPQDVLVKIHRYLKPSGTVLASIPNMMHYSVILDLLKGNFTYQDRGILDRTHMRFFTLNEIKRMFMQCGYRISSLDTIPCEIDLSDEDRAMLDGLTKLPGTAPEHMFHAYEYLVKAVATT